MTPLERRRSRDWNEFESSPSVLTLGALAAFSSPQWDSSFKLPSDASPLSGLAEFSSLRANHASVQIPPPEFHQAASASPVPPPPNNTNNLVAISPPRLLASPVLPRPHAARSPSARDARTNSPVTAQLPRPMLDIVGALQPATYSFPHVSGPRSATTNDLTLSPFVPLVDIMARSGARLQDARHFSTSGGTSTVWIPMTVAGVTDVPMRSGAKSRTITQVRPMPHAPHPCLTVTLVHIMSPC